MSNPTLNDNITRNFTDENVLNPSRPLTASGVIGKTSLLFAVLIAVAYFTFSLSVKGFMDKANLLYITGAIGGLITAFFICFRPYSKFMVPATFIYSIFEGLFVGAVSGSFAAAYGGALILNAVLATFASLIATLFLYKAGIIKCTEKFRSTIIAATFGIFIIYMFTFITSFFSPYVTNFVFGSGMFALGLNVVVCIIAVLNFILDFDLIENLERVGVPERYEWYCGFSLMVTIVWVYIEFLRLFARLNRK